MRIVFDLQACQTTVNKNRGIGRYSMALTRAIIRRGKHDFWLALNGLFPETIGAIQHAFSDLVQSERMLVFQVPGRVAESFSANLWRARAAELVREHFLANIHPDIVHVSSLFEGFVDDAVTSIRKGVEPDASTVTLYDLIPYVHADTYLTNSLARDWYFRKLQSLKNADLCLAISQHSRMEALGALCLPEDSVVNVSAAADMCFRPREYLLEEKQALRSRYGLYRPFVMYTGGIDQRKNIEGLIEAYARLPNEVRIKHQLAIVCSTQETDRQRLLKLVSGFGLRKDEVILTGYVSNVDLVALYNLCELFVLPSLHEGFGLPALEAMASGAAVIGSNTTSIPEVIGRTDALFDPSRSEAIAEALHHVLTDAAFHQSLREHAPIQAAKFSWDESARRTLEALEELAARQRAQNRTLVSLPERPTLAYVSPLPSESSGICDYSAELLPELARYYEIDLIVDQPKVEHPWLVANFPVRSAAWFDANARRFDRVLYHFGNSTYHKHMFGLLERYPGVVVLHDFFLGHVMDYLENTGYVSNAFKRALYFSHGYQPFFDIRKSGIEAAVLSYPCNKQVIDEALGVIIHSQYTIDVANRWYGKDLQRKFRLVPQLRSVPVLLDRTAARERLGISEQDFLICSFGILGSNKVNHLLLQSWLNSSLSEEARSRLVFVGENDAGDYGCSLVSTIRQSSARDRISITGFVANEIYRDYLCAADLAVQLRSRSRGETSRAVLDVLAHGLPVIINAHGPMAEFPDKIMVKLADNFSEAELTHALENLWRDYTRRDGLAEAAREYVRLHHQPAKVAGQYRDAIEHFAETSDDSRRQRLLTSLARISTPVKPAEADLQCTASSIALNSPEKRVRQLLLDVSVLIRTDAKSGIQRTVRSILLQLLQSPPSGFRVEPVYGDGKHFYYARHFMLGILGIKQMCLEDEFLEVQYGDIFIGLDLSPEVIPASRAVLNEFRLSGGQIFFVVYDLFPLLRPDWCDIGVPYTYSEWMNLISTISHGLICISHAVADELNDWLKVHQPMRDEPLKIGYFHLGADIDKSISTSGIPKDAPKVLQALSTQSSFLTVGTVEPRKGIAQTVTAFEKLWNEGVVANLVIVGKQGWMVDSLVGRLRNHPELGKRLFWLESISDEYLEKIYTTSTALIAPSEGEGFGLPLVEAAQHKLPILARDLPVFREVAGEHAFYFSGEAPEDLAAAIKEWLDLYARGKAPCSGNMPWITWSESARQLIDVIFDKK